MLNAKPIQIVNFSLSRTHLKTLYFTSKNCYVSYGSHYLNETSSVYKTLSPVIIQNVSDTLTPLEWVNEYSYSTLMHLHPHRAFS